MNFSEGCVMELISPNLHVQILKCINLNAYKVSVQMFILMKKPALIPYS